MADCRKHGLSKGFRCLGCDKDNKKAEEKGRENFYASYKFTDNPYPKNSTEFLAWAYGFSDAKHIFEKETNV